MASPECNGHFLRAKNLAKDLAKLSVSELMKRGFLEEAKARIDELEAELADVKDTLQSLADIQNGSPLIRDEEKWQAIMDKAYKLLSKP